MDCRVKVQRVFALQLRARFQENFETLKDGIRENFDILMKDQIYVTLDNDKITFFSILETEALRAELVNRILPQIVPSYRLIDMAVHLV